MAWRERSSYTSRHGEDASAAVTECKVIMVGTVSVGKTSIASRYVRDTFRPSVTTTIGASYMWKKETYDSDEVKLSIWDTAGQEQFYALVPMYFREADAVVLVVDVTADSCLREAEMWLEKVNQNAPADTVIFLTLNKIDHEDRRMFFSQDAEKFSQAHNDGTRKIEWCEVSAKTGEGVHEAFRRIGQRCLDAKRAKRAGLRGNNTEGPNSNGNKLTLSAGKRNDRTSKIKKACC